MNKKNKKRWILRPQSPFFYPARRRLIGFLVMQRTKYEPSRAGLHVFSHAGGARWRGSEVARKRGGEEANALTLTDHSARRFCSSQHCGARRCDALEKGIFWEVKECVCWLRIGEFFFFFFTFWKTFPILATLGAVRPRLITSSGSGFRGVSAADPWRVNNRQPARGVLYSAHTKKEKRWIINTGISNIHDGNFLKSRWGVGGANIQCCRLYSPSSSRHNLLINWDLLNLRSNRLTVIKTDHFLGKGLQF